MFFKLFISNFSLLIQKVQNYRFTQKRQKDNCNTYYYKDRQATTSTSPTSPTIIIFIVKTVHVANPVPIRSPIHFWLLLYAQ